MRTLIATTMLALGLAGSALANDIKTLCGEPPVVTNDTLKGELDGKASLIKRLVGQAEFTGVVEATREDVFENYPNADEARANAYLFYVACALTVDDKKMNAIEKLDAIAKFRAKLLADKVSAIEFTYYSIDFAAVRQSGRNFIVDLIVKNTNPNEYGIAVAFMHTKMVPSCLGTLRPSCKAKVSLSDGFGGKYFLGEVSGLGLSRDADDWTILKFGENVLVSLEFGSQGVSLLGREFVLDGEIIAVWRIDENNVSKPQKKAFSIKHQS